MMWMETIESVSTSSSANIKSFLSWHAMDVISGAIDISMLLYHTCTISVQHKQMKKTPTNVIVGAC